MAKKENEIKEKKQKNSYFKEMKAELKKVVWPTPKELVNNTIAVIVFVLIIAIIVFIFDFCFDNLNKYVITTLQDKVISYLEPEEEDLDGEDDEDEFVAENVEANESTEGETTEGNENQDSEANGEESQNNEDQNSEENSEENQNNNEQTSNEEENSSEE